MWKRRPVVYYSAGATVIAFVAGILLWFCPILLHNPYIPDPKGDSAYRTCGVLLSSPALCLIVAYIVGWLNVDLGHWDPDASAGPGTSPPPSEKLGPQPGQLALPDASARAGPMRPSKTSAPEGGPPRRPNPGNRALALYAPAAEASVWAITAPFLMGMALLLLAIIFTSPSDSSPSLGHAAQSRIDLMVKAGMLSTAAGFATFILTLPIGLYGAATKARWMATITL